MSYVSELCPCLLPPADSDARHPHLGDPGVWHRGLVREHDIQPLLPTFDPEANTHLMIQKVLCILAPSAPRPPPVNTALVCAAAAGKEPPSILYHDFRAVDNGILHNIIFLFITVIEECT